MLVLKSPMARAMLRACACLVSLAAILFVPNRIALAQGAVPGKSKSEFSVSPSGGAAYRIPIDVPPGVAGMQPSLALTYSSHAPNGMLGMGWSLAGLSAITRCPRSMATDGVRGGVAFTPDDRFCLDGQRLINVTGVYGAADSEYRTEVDGFSRIMALGAAGGNAANGPERFLVHTKAGVALEYGSAADARVTSSSSSAVHGWTLSRMVDAKGNAVVFSYLNDAATFRHRIASITYGAVTVTFDFEGRQDTLVSYLAGAKAVQSERLMKLRVLISNQPSHEYRLSYGPAADAPESLLTGVQKCAANGDCGEPTNFAYRGTPASQFTPATSTLNVASTAIVLAHMNQEPQISYVGGDFNGDGQEDVVVFTVPGLIAQTNACPIIDCGVPPPYTRYRLLRSNGDGGFHSHDEQFGFNVVEEPYKEVRMTSGDVNGDGIADLIGYSLVGATFRTMVATGSASGVFTHHAYQQHVTQDYTYWNAAVVDLNGDGRTDVLAYFLGPTGLKTVALLSNGASGFTHQSSTTHISTDLAGWQLQANDLNGDGLTDLLIYHVDASGIKTREMLNTGAGGFSVGIVRQVFAGDLTDWGVTGADLNGDGLIDLLGLKQSNGFTMLMTRALLRRGDGTYEAGAAQALNMPGVVHGPGAGKSGWTLLVNDLNHDGRTDIAAYGVLNGGLLRVNPYFYDDVNQFVARNAQDFSGLPFTVPPLGSEESAKFPSVQASGFRGDGSSHLLVAHRGNQQVCIDAECNMGTQHFTKIYPLRNLGATRLLNSVSSGGATLQIAYGSAAYASVHTKEGSAVYPQVAPSPALQVVTSVSRSNGVGGLNVVSHTYGGLRGEHSSAQHPGSGRGFLGFRWMKAKDVASGVETYTEFAQAWPYVGQVVKNETRLAGAGNAGVLKRTVNTHACYQSHVVAGGVIPASPTAPCGAWAAGKVVFPVLTNSVEDSWELNGLQMPGITTLNTFGGYADAAGTPRQWGDLTQIEVSIEQAGQLKHRKVTINEYQPAKTAAGQWQLGRLKKATVTSTKY